MCKIAVGTQASRERNVSGQPLPVWSSGSAGFLASSLVCVCFRYGGHLTPDQTCCSHVLSRGQQSTCTEGRDEKRSHREGKAEFVGVGQKWQRLCSRRASGVVAPCDVTLHSRLPRLRTQPPTRATASFLPRVVTSHRTWPRHPQSSASSPSRADQAIFTRRRRHPSDPPSSGIRSL